MTAAAGEFAVQAHERIIFGRPAAEGVAKEAARAGARRVCIVTNRSLARLVDGPLQAIEESLGERHAATFARMSAHSRVEDTLEAARVAREAGADLLVALGGGSVIDGTKATLLCLWRNLRSVEDWRGLADGEQDGAEIPPHPIRAIAVPTTLSAAEFTSTAAVNDEATQTKRVLSQRFFAARSIVLDPASTLATPMRLLLATGMRAVDHAIETWCSPAANPVTEAHSLQGLRLLARALPAIAHDPQDIAPRLAAQLGMWQAVAPVASGVVVGASHGIGYVLGGTYGVPHGETSCVLLPAVLQWNARTDGARQRELARAIGAPGDDLPAFVARLIDTLGLPRTLGEVGIAPADVGDIAERALAYPAVIANPRPIRCAADAREILRLAS